MTGAGEETGAPGAQPAREPVVNAQAVTVIIPAYNASRYLDRTLDSARNQTHANLEIVVIDDGSTDDTAAIAKRHAALDPRVKVFSTPNGGECAARNKGLELASSELVAFLDADDLWQPTKIAKQVAALDSHSDDPSWAAVYAFTAVIDEDDRFVHFGGRVPARGFILASDLVMKFIGHGSSLLVKKSVALDIGGFDPIYSAGGVGGCGDLDFELRLAARFQIEVVPEVLIGYRTHSGNASSKLAWMLSGLKHVTEKCIRDNPQLSARVRRYARSHATSYAAQRYAATGQVVLLIHALAKLACLDPRLLLEVAPRILMRWKGDALRARLRGRSSSLQNRTFFEIDPSADTGPHQSMFMKRRVSYLFNEDRLVAVHKNGIDK